MKIGKIPLLKIVLSTLLYGSVIDPYSYKSPRHCTRFWGIVVNEAELLSQCSLHINRESQQHVFMS